MATSICAVQHPDGSGGLIPLTIQSKTHSAQHDLRANIVRNIKRETIRFLTLPGLFLQRHEPIAIVGGGPSLPNYIDKIKGFRHVMACGSVHDYLVENGVTPTFAIIADALPRHAGEFQKTTETTSYLVASQVHPDLFDMLERQDRKVAMWHFAGQLEGGLEEEKIVLKNEPTFAGNGPAICWGCMTGVIAPQMALYLGFQDMHFFGFDGSVLDWRHHAYHVPEDLEVRATYTPFTLNGRTFISTMSLVSQIEHLFDFFYGPDGIYVEAIVYSDGFWPWIIKQSDPALWKRLRAAGE